MQIPVHVPDHTGDDFAIAHVGAIQGHRGALNVTAKSQPRAQMIIPCVMALAFKTVDTWKQMPFVWIQDLALKALSLRIFPWV